MATEKACLLWHHVQALASSFCFWLRSCPDFTVLSSHTISSPAGTCVITSQKKKSLNITKHNYFLSLPSILGCLCWIDDFAISSVFSSLVLWAQFLTSTITWIYDHLSSNSFTEVVFLYLAEYSNFQIMNTWLWRL